MEKKIYQKPELDIEFCPQTDVLRLSNDDLEWDW